MAGLNELMQIKYAISTAIEQEMVLTSNALKRYTGFNKKILLDGLIGLYHIGEINEDILIMAIKDL